MSKRKRYPKTPWSALARARGYKQERDLLEDLYVKTGLSIQQVADHLNRSYTDVKYQLTMNGIALRERGGPNRRRADG